MGFKKYESLEFTDDFMFCKIMENEPELCEELTSLVLDRPVRIAGTAEKQKVIEIVSNGRGIRMDIYFEGEDDVLYNLEMQNSNEGDLPKRSRYYQSMMDLAMMERGMNFNEMEQSYVVFLCRFDPFERDLYRYTFRNTCKEDSSLELKDGALRVFLNAKSAAENASEEMKALLLYLSKGRATSEMTRRIEQSVEAARAREEWKVLYFEQNSREAAIRKETEKITEDRFGELNIKLISENRLDDLKRASMDKVFRNQLYEEYGIE